MRLPVLLVALALPFACTDPAHEAEVDALGPEAPGVRPGPTHRPGQPCLTCHGGQGPGGETFVTAGTVYVSVYAAGVTPSPAVGIDVHLVDSKGSTHDTTTNSVGNFYVTTDEWDPVFPLGGQQANDEITVAPTAGSTAAFPMTGTIDRGGAYASCAYCHFDPPGPKSVGHVYLTP